MKEQEQAGEGTLLFTYSSISRISKEQVHSRSPYYKVELIWNDSKGAFSGYLH
jgi:hypothetical protein